MLSRGVKHIAFTVFDHERALVVGVVLIAGMIPAVIPVEAEVLDEQRHHNGLGRAFFHGDNSYAVAFFVGDADGSAFPSVAAFVGKIKYDVAFWSYKDGYIVFFIETIFVSSYD